MLGLEYALLFGLPENKLEIVDGKATCRLPFATLAEAEAQFDAWAETLCRWQDAGKPSVTLEDNVPTLTVNGFVLRRYRRVLELKVPLDDLDALERLESFGWDGDSWHWHWNVGMNLYRLSKRLMHKNGWAIGRVDVVMSDRDVLQPDWFYFAPDKVGCLVNNAYFLGVPNWVVEATVPAMTAFDRQRRFKTYERLGIPHLWLVDVERETVEVFEWRDGHYELLATLRRDGRWTLPLFPNHPIRMEGVLPERTHYPFGRVWHCMPRSRRDLPSGYWAPPEKRLGLQWLLLAGHPDRRYEILHNRSPCAILFGSEQEAKHRFSVFAEEIARWEDSSVSPKGEVFECGRFRLWQDGEAIWLEVATDAQAYRAMLDIYHDPNVWQEAWEGGK